MENRRDSRPPFLILLRGFFFDDHFEMGGHVLVQLHRDHEFAKCPQCLVQLDFAAIDVEALFLKRVPDVTGRDRTEKLIVLSGAALERNRETVELLG